MLQLPQIQITQAQAKPAKDAPVDSATKGSSDGGFGDFLDAVTEGPLPSDLKADLVQQVEDGVPIAEVLANLLDGLREQEEVALAPGMLPVLQAMVPHIEIPADALGARLAAGRHVQADPAQVAATNQAGQASQTEAESQDLALELEGGDLPQGEQLLGKHKALLASRVTALESTAASTVATTATQHAAQRIMDLPAAMGPLMAAAAADDVDAPLSQQLLVAPKVGDPQWGQALAQRVVWMVGQEKQSAELRLNPAHLGPVEVKLTLQHDQASLSLMASNAATRDAIEQALPRLRDMLGQQDIQLTHVDVGHRQDRHGARADGGQDGHGQGHGFGRDGGGEGDQQAADAADVPRRMVGRGLVDAYV